ncbi:MAG: DNA gyrase inhibitor YacG [Caldimonas sp.]
MPTTMPRIIVCPACGGASVYAESNPDRPFCSRRCKDNDFGAWASEDFRIAPARAPEDHADSDD